MSVVLEESWSCELYVVISFTIFFLLMNLVNIQYYMQLKMQSFFSGLQENKIECLFYKYKIYQASTLLKL